MSVRFASAAAAADLAGRSHAGGSAPAAEGAADGLLVRALSERPAGRWSGFVPADELSTLDCFRDAVAEFDRVAGSLSAAAWSLAVPTYGSALDLVAHLIGIEEYVARQIGLDSGDAAPEVEASHASIAQGAIDRHRGRSPSDLRGMWRSTADAIVERVGALPARLDDPASWHGAPFTVGQLLVIRTFELWTHADDLRVADRRARESPTSGQLRHMTGLASALVPAALDLAGTIFPGQTVRLVLTGPGGGTWRCPLAPGDDVRLDDDLLVVVDAVGFCRLAANRVAPDDLDVYVEGNQAAADALLRAMSKLAAD